MSVFESRRGPNFPYQSSITTDVLNAESGSILVFIDETGHEEFADNRYPVFGLGGCLFPANYSSSIVDAPWKNLKETHFPEFVSRPFHAAEIRTATPQQAEALGTFFKSTPFRRFASVTRASANNPDLIEAIRVVVPSVMKQVSELLKDVPLTALHLIWEDSERLNQALGAAIVQISFRSTSGKKIPTTYSCLPKSSSEPGLEIADCIIHTAGCQVRNNMKGQSVRRQDFNAVFCSRPKLESAFIEITGYRIEKVQKNSASDS